ncbi:rhodanese-like domain-containing protein [Catellatospora chokoriensis]|uniref:Sulfurtransferase n=1 Tax=Catellatospora chokoriensis TaxID=310353 RepID=A0A8J3KC21_9ACTN|nr:rhodanese-like domain-containing protein [Catellatospora chokoriensis]GIF94008.1 sulfurtransferase [Catellatospora chokoriensis]
MTTTASATISVTATRALIAFDPDVLLVDVRTPGEYETAHIAGSINLPLDQVDSHLQYIVAAAGTTMVVVCQSGNRAGQCQTKLAAAGLTDTAVMTGGMNAWLAEDGPVIRGRQRWSLERQVRLAAGGIVLTSILVSIWFPAARYLAGFIGAGLTFAALTDTCAMGMMLSKLPYNRSANSTDVRQALSGLRDRNDR